jgi:hypothetical protein
MVGIAFVSLLPHLCSSPNPNSCSSLLKGYPIAAIELYDPCASLGPHIYAFERKDQLQTLMNNVHRQNLFQTWTRICNVCLTSRIGLRPRTIICGCWQIRWTNLGRPRYRPVSSTLFSLLPPDSLPLLRCFLSYPLSYFILHSALEALSHTIIVNESSLSLISMPYISLNAFGTCCPNAKAEY